ncbi:MAG: tetratricopeptide repeat protein [Chloroflexota bacterium]
MRTKRQSLRTIVIVCLLLASVFALVLPIAAQDDADPTPEPETLQSLVERAETAAERAEAVLAEMEDVADRAESAIDLAGNLFGLFEALSAGIGLVVPFLAIVAGLLGFRRLEQANKELRDARERFEKDMRQRADEMERVRQEMEATTSEQREQATAASVALALLPVGERQYRAQDYPGALDTYLRALEFDKNNPIIHYRLGYVYTQSGKLDDARVHLQKALKLDPQFHPARAALGYVFRRVGDAMQKEIDRLLDAGVEAKSPELARMRIDRDKTYIRSEEYFVDALSKLPKLMDEDGESWWGALGGLYRRRGQTQQALNAYQQGTEVTPQSSYPFSNLALLYAEVGDLDKMRNTYRRVEQLAYSETRADVDNYWAYADLIVARLAQGKVQETYDVLDTALQTAPVDSPYTLESLIDTLSRLGRFLPDDQRSAIDKVITYIRNFIADRAQRQETSEALVARLTSEQRAVNPVVDSDGSDTPGPDDSPGAADE